MAQMEREKKTISNAVPSTEGDAASQLALAIIEIERLKKDTKRNLDEAEKVLERGRTCKPLS